MKSENGRVTTREFYAALLQIKPQLQKIHDRVKTLYEWAQGENGVEKRLGKIGRRIESVEKRHVADDARSKTLSNIGKVLQAVIYATIALLSALIGKDLG